MSRMGGYLDNASIMQQHGMIEQEDDMRGLQDDYNAENPNEAVDGYEYQRPGDPRMDDAVLAIRLLASHVKNLYRKLNIVDPEIDMEIAAIMNRLSPNRLKP